MQFIVFCDALDCDYEIQGFSDDKAWAEQYATNEQRFHNLHCPGLLSVVPAKEIITFKMPVALPSPATVTSAGSA